MIKELEDYTWFPEIFRKWQLEFVGNISVWTQLYKPMALVLGQMITDNKLNALQDVCSGSGIPAAYIHRQLNTTIPLLLTDKYPDTAFENKPPVFYSLNPADVMELQPVENTGYTMYNAFHHFSAAQQKALVQKMADNNVPVLIAELLEPGLWSVIKIVFTATIVQLFTAPFAKPFSLLRLLFTYIIPVNLFTVAYDGVISVLRSKTAAQYNELLNNISTPFYHITVNRVNNWKGNLVYIKGEPANK